MLDEVSTESLTVTHIFDGEEVVTGGEDGQVWIATFATRRAAQTFIDWVQMAWMSIEGERRERSAVETTANACKCNYPDAWHCAKGENLKACTCECHAVNTTVTHCQHDLLLPDMTVDVLSDYDARCRVCFVQWRIQK